MTLTPSLELTFPADTLPLCLGDSLDQIEDRVSGWTVKRTEIIDAERVYIELIGMGVEMLFKEGALASVTLHLAGDAHASGIFTGRTNLLDRATLEDPSDTSFVAVLEAQGFKPSQRSYPFATDRLNDVMRIRLEARPDRRFVLIDSGARVR